MEYQGNEGTNFCIIDNGNATQKDNSNLNGASVHDKLDADICPVCQDVFYTATELMKHVFDEHYCLRCLKSCRHEVATNKLALSESQENLAKETQTDVTSSVTNVTPNVVSVETQTNVVIHAVTNTKSIDSTGVTSELTNEKPAVTSVTPELTTTKPSVPNTNVISVTSVVSPEETLNVIENCEQIESDEEIDDVTKPINETVTKENDDTKSVDLTDKSVTSSVTNVTSKPTNVTHAMTSVTIELTNPKPTVTNTNPIDTCVTSGVTGEMSQMSEESVQRVQSEQTTSSGIPFELKKGITDLIFLMGPSTNQWSFKDIRKKLPTAKTNVAMNPNYFMFYPLTKLWSTRLSVAQYEKYVQEIKVHMEKLSKEDTKSVDFTYKSVTSSVTYAASEPTNDTLAVTSVTLEDPNVKPTVTDTKPIVPSVTSGVTEKKSQMSEDSCGSGEIFSQKDNSSGSNNKDAKIHVTIKPDEYMLNFKDCEQIVSDEEFEDDIKSTSEAAPEVIDVDISLSSIEELQNSNIANCDDDAMNMKEDDVKATTETAAEVIDDISFSSIEELQHSNIANCEDFKNNCCLSSFEDINSNERVDKENDCNDPNDKLAKPLIKVRTDLFSSPKPSKDQIRTPLEMIQEYSDDETNQEKVEYKCDYCTKKFPSKAQVEFHMKRMEATRRLYTCNKSNCNFRGSMVMCAWNEHRMTVHSNEGVKMVVQGLGQAVPQKAKPKSVEIQNVKPKPIDFKCDKCHKVFKSAEAREQHHIAKHVKIPEPVNGWLRAKNVPEKQTQEPKSCGHCDKSYATENELKSHWEADHHQQKPSQIIRPYKRTGEPSKSAQQDLENLRLKRPRLTIYKCDQCHKSFDSENGLKSHIDIVHKIVKIKCQFCEELFDSEGHKAKHVEEIHQVKLRNLKILNMVRVDQVKKAIEKKKFFQCNICMERFDSDGAVTRHKANVHGKKQNIDVNEKK